MADSKNFDEGYNVYDTNEEHLELLNIDENFNEICFKIKQRTAFIDTNERGRIVFVYGNHNTGKSFLIRYFAWLCKERYSECWKVTTDGRITHPIIIKNLVASIRSVEGFYTWLLESLGNPVDSRQLREWEKTKIKLIKLRHMVIKTLNAYETRMLILDESQRLLKAGDKLKYAEIFEALKDLTTKNHWDELGCSNRTNFVLCGTTDCLFLLRAGKFIQGRVHTRPLEPISGEEYPTFLATIYADFIELGVSQEWDLFYEEGDGLILNKDHGTVLYTRTQGLAGLTVEIIRHAVLSALEQGRDFPQLKDYQEVILEGTKYIIKEAQEMGLENQEKLKDQKSIHINVDMDNLICAFRGCPKSKKPYVRPYALIEHYKNEHPEAEVYDSEGTRLDNN